MSEHSPAKPRSLVVHYLGRIERVVLSLIAFILVILAVLLLASNAWSLVQAVIKGQFSQEPAINVLDGVLLVMMTMEIVYTVTLSLESHKLAAEPFLVIGIIAAIRRTLVITAEATKYEGDVQSQPIFQSMLLELGLLSFIVVIMAISIAILRRTKPSEDEEEAEEEVAKDQD